MTYKTYKILIVVPAAALLFLAFLIFRPGPAANQPADDNSKKTSAASDAAEDAAGPAIPAEIQLKDDVIPLTWADNNDNENLIIQSDRQYYDAGEETEIFFSVSNTTEKDQNTDVVFWFDGEDKALASVERIKENGAENPKFEIRNPKQIPNSKFQIQNRKDIKGYNSGSYFQDTIFAGQTNFYKAVIKFPQNSQGEFFIEAFGTSPLGGGGGDLSLIGYGHLDPYYASGLIGMWSFNGSDTNWTSATAGTTNDLSGNNNTGTLTNMSRSSSPAPGISGQALNFDGVNDYVVVGSSASLDSATGAGQPRSWGYWIYYKGGANKLITDKATNFTGGHFWSETQTTYIRGGVAPTGSVSTGTLSLNRWYHIFFTYDGAQTRLYLDGVLKAGPNSQTAPADDTAPLYMMGYTTAAYSCAGILDEVRVYNRALSADEIQDLYRLGSARLKANTPESGYFKSGLVGMWSFDGPATNWTSATAGTTQDLSGNNNTGTLTNMSRSSSPVPGISGQALNFDGVNDYVSFGGVSTPGSFTFSAWVYPKSGSGSIIVKKTTTFYHSLQMISITQVRLVVYCSGSTIIIASPVNSVTLNKWNHVAVNWNGQCGTNASVTFVVNGVASTNTNLGSGDPPIDLAGGWISYTSNFFNGLIDEVRIYNRALSADEIQDLYRLGSARLKANTPESGYFKSGLVGMWSFDGQATNWTSATAGTTNDLSGNNNTGTLTNMSRSSSPVPGISGQALNFDGCSGCAQDDYINAGSASVLDDMPALTISVWAKANSYGQYSQGYFVNKSNVGASGWRFQKIITNSTVIFAVDYDGATDLVVDAAANTLTTSDFGKWIYWAVTWDGSSNTSGVHIYKNGSEVRYSPANTNGQGNRVSDQAQNLFIGNNTVTSQIRTFDGLIDEVRVYSRALSADEIQQLYLLGSRRAKITL